MIGDCRLCGRRQVDIQASHILSKWIYRRLRLDAELANPNPIVVHGGKTTQTSRQITAPLLCEQCEQSIGRSENYVARIAYKDDGRAEIFDFLDGVVQANSADEMLRRPRFVSSTDLDREALTRFAVSTIWRAAVAGGDMSGRVVLSTPYANMLGEYLLGRGDFPTFARLAVVLLDHPADSPHRTYAFATMPETVQTHGHDLHAFFACGLMFQLYIGGDLPGYLDRLCLHHAALPMLVLSPAQSIKLLHDVATVTRSAGIGPRLSARAEDYARLLSSEEDG